MPKTPKEEIKHDGPITPKVNQNTTTKPLTPPEFKKWLKESSAPGKMESALEALKVQIEQVEKSENKINATPDKTRSSTTRKATGTTGTPRTPPTKMDLLQNTAPLTPDQFRDLLEKKGLDSSRKITPKTPTKNSSPLTPESPKDSVLRNTKNSKRGKSKAPLTPESLKKTVPLHEQLVEKFSEEEKLELENYKKYLNSHGADLNSVDKNGNNLLHSALIIDNLKLVKNALGIGIDPNSLNIDGKNALSLTQNQEIISLLRRFGAKESASKDSEVARPATPEQGKKNQYLTPPTTPEKTTSEGSLTPTSNGDQSTASTPRSKFIKNAGSANTANNLKQELLKSKWSMEIILNYPDKTTGNTLLHTALITGDIEKVKLLLNYGSNPNVRNKEGKTPLFYATNLASVNLLLKNGADATVRVNNQTPRMLLPLSSVKKRLTLFQAERDPNLGILSTLKSDKDILKLRGILTSPQYEEFNENQWKNLLFGRNYSDDSRYYNDNTSLHLFCLAGIADFIEMVLDKKSIKVLNKNDQTALHLLSMSDNAAIDDEIVKILLNYSEDKGFINLLDSFGNTALHYATQNSQQDLLCILIKNGANVLIKNNEGVTASTAISTKWEDIDLTPAILDGLKALRAGKTRASKNLNETVPTPSPTETSATANNPKKNLNFNDF